MFPKHKQMQNICLDMCQVWGTLPYIANSSKDPGESRNPAHTFMGLAFPIFAQPHGSSKNEYSLLTFGTLNQRLSQILSQRVS